MATLGCCSCLGSCLVLHLCAVGAAPTGEVFKLEMGPLPAENDPAISHYARQERIEGKLPPGVKGIGAKGYKVRVWSPREQCLVIVARSSEETATYDRLYVDANRDGRFDKNECYDLTRTAGPVKVTKTRSGSRAEIRPVMLVRDKEGDGSPCWVRLGVRQRGKGQVDVLASNLTCASGTVRFGEREVRLALYIPRLGLEQVLGQGVQLPGEAGDVGSKSVRRNVQVIYDANGNGRFDNLSLYDCRPENQWLTRLLRVDGKYYALEAAEDGLSIRVTPAKPRIGKLAIPADLRMIQILGPEFALGSREADKTVELPAGRYVVMYYCYQSKGGQVQANDSSAGNVLEILSGQTTKIEVGPPLRMDIKCSLSGIKGNASESYRTLGLTLKMTDRAGRPITGVYIAKGRRPVAPRFRIVDRKGKTVLSDAFKYG